jgi:hypothetical protein
MKKILMLLVLVLSFGLASPAHGILGLSTCEKVKKSILKEEAVGRSIWQDFDRNRKNYVRKQSIKAFEYIFVLRQQTGIYESDMLIFRQASKNPKCFSAKLLGKIRFSEVQTKASLKEVNSAIAQFDLYSTTMLSQQLGNYSIDYLKSTYLEFVSIYSWKV